MPIIYRQAHNMLIENSWKLGKDSYCKYMKNGVMFPLPYHGDKSELSIGIEKQLRNYLKKD